QLKKSDDLVSYFRTLIQIVYADPNLKEERVILHEETQNLGKAEQEKFKTKELQILLKVRRAIMKALKSAPRQRNNSEDSFEYIALKNLVLAMADGDLAWTTRHYIGRDGDEVILGDNPLREIFNDLRLSPELQIEIAKANDNRAIELARNHYLTDETQIVLSKHNNSDAKYQLTSNLTANSPEMMRNIIESEGEESDMPRINLVFTTRDFPPEILELIKNDPKLDLIHRAKKDRKAEIEMIEEAIKIDDEIWMNFLASRATLLSEEAVRKIHKIRSHLIQLNKNLTKYSDLMNELGLKQKE
ncbi:MAG: hypothetical protein WC806_02280, partial [Candidatus Gracilibacteria bacterium]